MAKYCGYCGAKLDVATGLCPNCDAAKIQKRAGGDPTAHDGNNKMKQEGNPAESCEKQTAHTDQPDKTGNNSTKHTPGKIKKYGVVLLVVILSLCAVNVAQLIPRHENAVPFDIPAQPNKTKQLSNGDKLYTPGTSSIKYDADSSVVYFNDMLFVYTFSDLSQDDAQELAGQVKGSVVGDISGSINALQIQVEPSTLAELNSMAELLMKSDDVMYAGYDYPMQPDATASSDDPWSKDPHNPETDRGDEDQPDGNDWWAEAIGAYTAWQYSDQCQPIQVGILDSGVSTDHPELTGKTILLPDYCENTESDHGTHVAGIIAADANKTGIRGIADKASLVCVDFLPDDSTNYLTTGDYTEIIKQLIESGVQVVNNSWGMHVPSKNTYIIRLYWDDFGYFYEVTDSGIKLRDSQDEDGFDREISFKERNAKNVKFFINQGKVSFKKFKKSVHDGSLIRFVQEGDEITEAYFIKDDYEYTREQLADLLTGGYKSFTEYLDNMANRSALNCINMMSQLMLNGEKNFIIVQSAGNGYDNSGPGIDAKCNGYFCAIDKKLYNELSDHTRKRLSEKGIDYSGIRNRILIVGAVEKTVAGEEHHYKMAEYSNFGANVDICAPGGAPDGNMIFSTFTNDTYGEECGTSMAAPMVSGSLAYIWSLNPELSAPKVRDYLRQNVRTQADGVGRGKSFSYPMLNVGAAAKAVMTEKDQSITVPMDTDSQDHHYQIFHETLSWQEAKQKCEAMGGHLAVITSAEEQQVIENLNVQQENLWIGASRDESGAWAWVTGEPWSYTNWNEGEPNNSSNVAPNETCAAVWPKGWNDLANDNLYEQSGYICEWDGAQEPVVMDSGRLKRGVYVSSQDPGNILTVHQVDGDTAIFTVFWPRIASIDHAEATFQGTMGDFYYLDPSGGYHAAGQIVDHLDGTLVLTLTDSDLPYVPVGTAETYVLDETQAVEDWEPADSSNGILTEEQLENLKISLGVPEDMRVQYLQSDLSYWPSGRCWEVYVQILHEGNAIAMASVDPGSGEATRNILAYSGAEYPASISNPQPPASLIGDWKLDENEHSRVEYVDFKQNGEVTILYSTGEMETAPYRIESAGIVVTGQNTVHYYYMDGADLYLSEDLDRPALLYHLRE